MVDGCSDNSGTEMPIDPAYLMELRGQIIGEEAACNERLKRLGSQRAIIERALGMRSRRRPDPARTTATAAVAVLVTSG